MFSNITILQITDKKLRKQPFTYFFVHKTTSFNKIPILFTTSKLFSNFDL